MEQNYVSQELYNEFAHRIDRENERQDERITTLEKSLEKLNDITVSIARMTLSIEAMTRELTMQGQRLEEIEKEPAEKWKKFTWAMFTTTLAAIAALVFLAIGLTK